MKKQNKSIIVSVIILLILGYSRLYAQINFDLETGFVFSGYNDVRIPGNTGTKISLSKELETDPTSFLRLKLIYSINDKNSIAIFAAPLRLKANGKVDRLVKFEGEEFPANIPLEAKYRFDSYRLTYRYDFYTSDNLQIGMGLTAKIRDASISLEGNQKKSEKKNTGFVPLINFKLQWMFTRTLSLLVDGDALIGPQGRAEDILGAALYNLNKNIGLKLGYRILEGGADVDEVYNFSLFNYIVAGMVITF